MHQLCYTRDRSEDMTKEPTYKITLSIESFLEIKAVLFRKIGEKQKFLEQCIERKDEFGIRIFEQAIARLKKAEAEMEESRKLAR